MAFVACGINYKSAPLALREQLTQPTLEQSNRWANLLPLHEVSEAVLLSTCNRTELYCETSNINTILPLLTTYYNLSPNALDNSFYCYEGVDAIQHMLRVASGLDSMMIGEPQILGQIKQAFQLAKQQGHVGKQLRHVFPYIFSASKRIRHRSGIGNNPISIASAAVQLIGQLFSDYTQLRVFIIGSGETSSLVAKYLQQQGVHQFIVASRTFESAQQLASRLDGTPLMISDIATYLPQADVIISATACPLPFITQGMVKQALKQRSQTPPRPMFFLDLAVPRDVDISVGDLEHVQLFNIDSLHVVIEKGLSKRQHAATIAEQLIERELEHYIRRNRSLRANDIICDYRQHMQTLAQLELQRATQKLSSGQCQYSVLSEFCERLVNKLTHMPTVGLRKAASDHRDELFELAHTLFSKSIGAHDL